MEVHKDFCAIAEKLRSDYINKKKNNIQRINFLTFLRLHTKYISDKPYREQEKIVNGALITELMLIEKSSCTTRFYNGSDLTQMILDVLNVKSLSQISAEEKLIYLHTFYRYVQLTSHVDLKNQLFAEKYLYLNQIQTLISDTVQEGRSEIQRLLNQQPNFDVLKKQLEAITITPTQRKEMLEFINMIYESCLRYPDNPFSNTQALNTLLGVALYALLKIKQEYHLLSAERSELYKECLRILNIKRLEDVPLEKMKSWLQALSTHFYLLIAEETNENETVSSDSHGSQAVNDKQVKEIKIQEYTKYRQEIDAMYIALEQKFSSPSYLKWGFMKTNAWGARTVISVGAVALANQLTLKSLTGAAISMTGTPITFAFCSVAGTMMMTHMAGLVSPSVASLYKLLLDKISMQIGAKATDAATFCITMAKDGLQRLLTHESLSPKDKLIIDEWIETLLALPDETISIDEKKQLCYVLGLEYKAPSIIPPSNR